MVPFKNNLTKLSKEPAQRQESQISNFISELLIVRFFLIKVDDNVEQVSLNEWPVSTFKKHDFPEYVSPPNDILK